jgi:hypothetical protein
MYAAPGRTFQQRSVFKGLNGVAGMSVARFVLSFLIVIQLSACGTYIPDTQDFPGNQGDQQLLVQSVVQSIYCEVANDITDLYDQSTKYPALAPIAKTLDTWGIQLTLSLKTEEKGTLNPTVVFTPPNPATALFSLAGGASLTSDAIRTDKLYYYYKVRDLKGHRCPTGVQPSGPVSSPLIQTNLKFGDWLYDVFIPVGNNLISLPSTANGPLKSNVVYYEVSFEITTTGQLTPGWKFTHLTVNPTGTLAAATRDRTHDIQITMGPGDNSGLKGTALNAQLSGDLGHSVANGLKSLAIP